MRRAFDAVARAVGALGADPPPQLVFSRVGLDALSRPGDVRVMDLEGASPTTALLGFLAPPDVAVVGTAAGGWAVDEDAARRCGRPSASPDAVRVRMVVLLERTGRGGCLLRLAGGSPSELPLPDGMATDVLRRVLELPTPPPVESVVDHVAACWLHDIVTASRALGRRLTWPEAEVLRPAAVSTWDELRWLVLTRDWDVPGLPFELAAWMDEGIFARWCCASVAPLSDLRSDARRRLVASAYRRVLHTMAVTPRA